ncbi:MAG: hypothetical protein OXI79_03975 [Gammaproteobacteria bacterium]|nr:hypothetical protein [Gammaproteobacteria bacterium]
MRLGSLQDLCEDIVAGVEGAIGCALVDLTTGLPVTLKVRGGGLLDSSAMELLAATGVAYFNGSVGASPADAAPEDEIQEIQTTTDDAYFFMSRVPGGSQELLVLVTDRKSTNLGLGWMSMRQALGHIRSLSADAGSGEAGAVPSTAQATTTPDPAEDPAFAIRSRNRRSIWG